MNAPQDTSRESWWEIIHVKEGAPTLGVLGPALPWPIPVGLDPVPVGIPKIEGFADPMIGGPLQGNTVPSQTTEGPGQIFPPGIPESHMVEARGPGWRGSAPFRLPGVQPDVVVIAPGAEEGGPPAVPLGDLEPQGPRVESHGPLQVRHLQVHMAYHRLRGDGLFGSVGFGGDRFGHIGLPVMGN